MKKFRAIISFVFTSLTLLCISALNTFAATLGNSVLDGNDSKVPGTVATGDDPTLIIIIAAVAVVALAVIIISIIASKKKK